MGEREWAVEGKGRRENMLTQTSGPVILSPNIAGLSFGKDSYRSTENCQSFRMGSNPASQTHLIGRDSWMLGLKKQEN